MDARRQERIAENESFVRQLNERIQQAARGFDVTGPQDFVCECGEPGCMERVALTLDEYEEVRAHSRRFVIVPGHEIDEAEQVVEQNAEFAVVEKLEAGGRVAEQLDPRRN